MRPRGLLPCENAAIRDVARDPEKMQGFWAAALLGPPSADVESENSFFKEVSQLRSFFFGTFLPSSRWSRDTVNIEGFELAATSVATSDFQNFFWGPWRAPGDPPGKGKRSVFAPSLGARLAEQDPCVFARDYDGQRAFTL